MATFRDSLSSTIEGVGRAFNLPEFRLSEAVAQRTNVNDGGLNYDTPLNQAVQTDYNQYRDTGIYQPTAVQNLYQPAQSSEINPSAQNYQAPQSTAPTDTRQQQLEKMDRNPKQEEEYQNLLNSLRPNDSEINAVFDPLMSSIDRFEQTAREQQPGLISEAEQQALASRNLVEDARTGAMEKLGEQERQTELRQRNETNKQRQTLQELSQANRARFGGASSAGQAANELQYRQFQQSTGGIAQQAQQAMSQIGMMKNQAERDYQQGLQQVEVQKQKTINDINRRFQDRLAEIQAERGRVESEKANARRQAMQEFRNAVYQVRLQEMQWQRELEAQRMANAQSISSYENQLANYLSGGQQAADQFQGYNPSQIDQVINQQGTSNQTSAYQGFAGSSEIDDRFANFQPTGQISRDRF